MQKIGENHSGYKKQYNKIQKKLWLRKPAFNRTYFRENRRMREEKKRNEKNRETINKKSQGATSVPFD